jgi:hypothetical protein
VLVVAVVVFILGILLELGLLVEAMAGQMAVVVVLQLQTQVVAVVAVDLTGQTFHLAVMAVRV